MLEKALDIPKKKENYAFKDVYRLEGKVGSSRKSLTKPVITEIMLRQSYIRPLQI